MNVGERKIFNTVTVISITMAVLAIIALALAIRMKGNFEKQAFEFNKKIVKLKEENRKLGIDLENYRFMLKEINNKNGRGLKWENPKRSKLTK